MGTTLENVLEDANALMEHIKYWMDCSGNKGSEYQKAVQLNDELIELLASFGKSPGGARGE